MIEIARRPRRRDQALRRLRLPGAVTAALLLLGILYAVGPFVRFAAAATATIMLVAAILGWGSASATEPWPLRYPQARQALWCVPMRPTFADRFWLASERLRSAGHPQRSFPRRTSPSDGYDRDLDDLAIRFGRRGATRYQMALRMSATASGVAIMLFKDLAEDKDALEWLRYNAVRRITEHDPELARELLRSMTYQFEDSIVRLNACDRLIDLDGDAGRTAYWYFALDSRADSACRREAILELAAFEPQGAEPSALKYVRDERLPHADRFALAEQLLDVDEALAVKVLLVLAELWFDPLEQRIAVAALLMRFGQPCGRDKLLNCAMNANVPPELRLMAMGYLDR